MSTVADTPNTIRAFQLLAAKGAIKLEKLSMKMSRGFNAKAAWAKHYGLSARAKHDEVIAKIEAELTTLKEATHLQAPPQS